LNVSAFQRPSLDAASFGGQTGREHEPAALGRDLCKPAWKPSGIDLDFVAIGIHSCDIKIIWIKSTMPTASQTLYTRSKRPTEQNRRKRPKRQLSNGENVGRAVPYHGMVVFLIVSMLLVAAGWEIFRLILAIMTLD
jgi:hypothetical protein